LKPYWLRGWRRWFPRVEEGGRERERERELRWEEVRNVGPK